MEGFVCQRLNVYRLHIAFYIVRLTSFGKLFYEKSIMRIVVLDGYTNNPGDLSWDSLTRLGNVTVYERTPPELVVERSYDADLVLTNKVRFSADTITQLPNLRYIGVLATGYNIIDTKSARDAGITVTNIPAYSTPSVAQAVFALILQLANATAEHNRAVKSGVWSCCKDFSFTTGQLTELHGQTLGIFGLGAIGQATAHIGLAFGMRVLGHARSAKNIPGIKDVDRDTLLAESDIISLHCPLTPDTNELINSKTLALMKQSAWLINTGRGQLINEAELASALQNGVIAAAGLDVLSQEPPPADNPLLTVSNCIITPHIAWATLAARSRLMDIAVDNVQHFLADTPINVVH